MIDLSSVRGRNYWRSLEELADSGEFREQLKRDFPREAASIDGALSRREFATLLGALLAVGGLAGCGKPPREKIYPYARQPEGLVAGKPLYYATAMPGAEGALGLLVRSDMGRPTKIEGNPRHPASLGATTAAAQAEMFTFWDPDRSSTILRAGVPGNWSLFLEALTAALSGPRAKQGEGLRILTESVWSPTLAGQLETLLGRLPGARWHTYESVGRDAVRAGSRLAFDREVEPLFMLEHADVLLSLDADVLFRPREAHDFATRRRVSPGSERRGRLYSVEPMPTSTGAAADHRWPVRAGDIPAVAKDLLLALEGGEKKPLFDWIPVVVEDLKRHAGKSLVIAGGEQPPLVHALVAAINHDLGNVGKTLVYIDPPIFSPKDGMESLSALATDITAGKVQVLLVVGGNPAYTAPVDLDFERCLSLVPFTVHLGLYADETARRCHWHVPEAHFLESWSDTRGWDGTASIIQPLIAPLYEGRTSHEVLSVLLGEPGRNSYDLVRDHWKGTLKKGPPFDQFWRTSLHEGLIEGSAFVPRTLEPKTEAIRALPLPVSSSDAFELNFRPDPTIGDGRSANNPWLQELPKPLTKLTWDNAVMISPADAARHSLSSGEEIELALGGRSVKSPVWVVPGHAAGSLTLHLGYGRSAAGRIGTGVGFNAGVLRTRKGFFRGLGATLKKTGRSWRLACTQLHHSMEGRDPVRVTTVEALRRDPEAVHAGEEREPRPTLYPEFPASEYAWGMTIDLDACTNCNACVAACQVENNIPFVGKDQVLRGREMHWIRIDTYHEGSPDNPRHVHQPIPCMHCEKAPCEVVCPTFATSHSSEGLNQMVYNRCIGTRYCQNNCPYKVRRFNFFKYSDGETPSIQLLYNPEVTVRERGVMEKCTYCVQRIVRTRMEAEKEGRPIRDGEVRTACQQVCPSGAIVFGDLSRPGSAVSRLKASPLNYELLGELGTRPRTTYLARVRDPNPELERI